MNQNELSLKIKNKAKEEGFAVAAIASIPGSSRINLRNEALERWLDNNFHGEMKWMEAERRKNIELILEGAKSVLSVGFNYLSETNQNKENFKIGKFSQGEDYHKVIKKKLKNIGLWLNSLFPDCKWKICVDTTPLLEKAWAEESGLGWIGKNSNLINKEYGSWLSLGFMILNKELIPDKPSQSLCGQCDKCIGKCPTQAITEPFVINSQLCIAYHTIENRNENIPKQIKKNLNGWIAGCDICQDVCPWNQSVPKNNSYEAQPKNWMTKLDQEALKWNDEEWSENLKGTTLKRIKPWMWRRNIKAVIKN
tara:strand:+ start:179 stop:1105 length:927 start_codon:yes stop_codon:yes gene_type:complete